jgi:RNA polymerase sigma factor (sigma-70 family)
MRRSWLVETSHGELLTAAASGDQGAWDALVNRYTSLLWSIARSYGLPAPDAADAVQTTWLRLLEHLDQIADPERLPGWLATTTRRECMHASRGIGRRTGPSVDLLDIPDRAPGVDDGLLRDERDAALWRALGKLDEFCRRLLRVLSADPPPSYAEVSAALGIKVGSIGPTRARCLAKLRGLMTALAGGSRPDRRSV